MLEILFIMLLFFVLAMASSKASRFFSKLHKRYQQDHKAQEIFRKEVLERMDRIENPSDELDVRKALLSANKKYIEKKQIKEAMYEELGID